MIALEEAVMEIIVNAGQSRSLCFEALHAARKPSILRAEADQTVAASSSSLSGETGGGEESPGSIGQGAR